jgi:serine/threonine-protein kinase
VFHLLTGKQPYASSNPAAVIGSHLSSPPPRVAALRSDLGWLDTVLAKGMAKEPAERFDSCRQFAAALNHGDSVWIGSTADTRYAPVPPPPPPPRPVFQQPPAPVQPPGASTSRTMAMVLAGIAALLAVGLVAFVGAKLGQSPSAPPTAAPAEPMEGPVAGGEPNGPADPPANAPPPSSPSTGDLGLSTPITRPACNGQLIVVLGNVTTPGQYESGVSRLLRLHPGASYLRTDKSCPSLRQADDRGNPIYAVYRTAANMTDVCAQIRAAGGDTYGKRLDTTTDPTKFITC